MKKRFFVCLLLLVASNPSFGQDDLFDLIDEPTETIDYATATFKGTKVINGQSNEIPAKGVMQFLILHRFGAFSDDFFYNFFGLDNADIRLGFDYSITDWLNVGIGRSSFQKTYDSSVKFKILRQSSGARNMPISMTGYAAVFYNSLKQADGVIPEPYHRFSYSYELIIARKLNDNLSLAITPSLVHFNLVEQNSQPNDVIAIGLGGRYKFTRRVSLNLEYFPQVVRNTRLEGGLMQDYANSLSVGFDIETGGHIFQLFFSNSRGVLDPQFIAQTPGEWQNGDVYFGFNISRVFTMKKPEIPQAGF